MKILPITILLLLLSDSVKSQSTNFERILNGHESTVLSLDIDSQGKYLISGSFDTDVIIWDFNSGKLLKKYQGNNGGIWNVKISPDNSYVACGSWDNNQKAKGSSKNCLSILEQ